MPDEDIEYGDITSDDVYTEGDEDIDWDHVELVQYQIDGVNAIEDDAERLQAAQRWARELNGEEIA